MSGQLRTIECGDHCTQTKYEVMSHLCSINFRHPQTYILLVFCSLYYSRSFEIHSQPSLHLLSLFDWSTLKYPEKYAHHNMNYFLLVIFDSCLAWVQISDHKTFMMDGGWLGSICLSVCMHYRTALGLSSCSTLK